MLKFLSVATVAFFAVSSAVNAAPAQVLGEYGDWTAYYYQDGTSPVCYMVSAPKKDEGKYIKRGDIYAFVTHRPADDSFNVVNFVAGYNYKQNSKVTIKIGDKTFNDFFVDGDKAWAMNVQTDKEVVEAMKKYGKMIVHGTSHKGTETKDTYSLNGFSKAYRTISAKCKKQK